MGRSISLAFAAVVLAATYFAVPTPGPSQAADATPQNKPSPEASVPEASAPQMEKAQVKRLHTVPEDDLVKDHSVPPKFVRDLIATRPKEDLIICMAGCSPARDRVIYAQPSEIAPETATMLVPASPMTPTKIEAMPSENMKPVLPQPSAASAPRLLNAPQTTIQ
jgi:hypothetical protein